MQELLLEEAGLDLAQLRRLSRWGAMAPAIAARVNPVLHKRQQSAAPLRRVSLTSLGSAAASLPSVALSRVASASRSAGSGSSGGGNEGSGAGGGAYFGSLGGRGRSASGCAASSAFL